MSAPVSDSNPTAVDGVTSPVNAPASPVEDGSHNEPTENEPDQLTLRALVSTKEAGVIIGKAGKNVADLRDLTGVKAGVSKVVPGVNDRVLSVSGGVENVAYAYSEIARQLLETPLTPTTPASPPPNAFTSVRLLISHNLMGTIIGRQGLKIKQIQDVSGARMVASKDMLPQSTERVVEVQGTTEAVKVAILEIGRCLLEDYERGQGTVLYHPGAGGDTGVLAGGGAAVPGLVVGAARRASAGFGLPQGAPMGAFGVPNGGRRTSTAGPASAFQQQQQQLGQIPQQQQQQQQAQAPKQAPSAAQSATASAPESSLRTQNISIPSDMVGCIIGRAGSKITEIRRLSGSKISIAKVPHDETGERMFTIVGTAESNEKALFLLYNQLESEKTRRVEGAETGEGDDDN